MSVTVCILAANGVEGLEVMVEHPPESRVPRLHDAEAGRGGRARRDAVTPRLARVPVVMMSAIPESVVCRRCTGYVAFLRKPFDFDAITRGSSSVPRPRAERVSGAPPGRYIQ